MILFVNFYVYFYLLWILLILFQNEYTLSEFNFRVQVCTMQIMYFRTDPLQLCSLASRLRAETPYSCRNCHGQLFTHELAIITATLCMQIMMAMSLWHERSLSKKDALSGHLMLTVSNRQAVPCPWVIFLDVQVNYNLMTVNIAMAATGLYQLYRKISYDMEAKPQNAIQGAWVLLYNSKICWLAGELLHCEHMVLTGLHNVCHDFNSSTLCFCIAVQ